VELPTMEVATSQTQQTVNNMCLRSKKRTLELFVGNQGARPADDEASLRKKLAAKLNDEYGPIKHLPPPPKPAAAPTKKSVQPSRESPKEEVIIAGTHKFPPRAGVALTQENAESVEPELETGQYQNLIQTLPVSKAEEESRKQNWGIVAYQQSNALATTTGSQQQFPSSKSRALAIRNPWSQVKPDWHPPWKLMRVISGHLGWVRSVTVDPTNQWFATGSADRTIKIFDLASGTLKLTLTGHINAVRGLAVSARHPYLFSAAEDKMVKCWDLEYNKVIRHYHGHLSGVYCLALHPTIDIMVTGGRDSSARVWDIRTKAPIFVLQGHQSTVGAVACQSTDPQVISASHDATVRLWDLAKGQTQVTLTHHKKSVRAIALHPTEYAMATGSPDNIKQWKFPEGKFLKNYSGHQAVVNALAVNSDNVLVSGADNGSMYFWDWKSGYNFQRLQTAVQPGSLEAEAGIFALTFDQTGSRLISCEADKTIKIYKEDENATEETHPMDDWKEQLRAQKSHK